MLYSYLSIILVWWGNQPRYLKKSGEDISGLASNHKQTGIELAEASIQVLKTLKKESGGRERGGMEGGGRVFKTLTDITYR